jgi:hypothetical protein
MMDAMTLRRLVQTQIYCEGVDIHHNQDVEMVIKRGVKLSHVIITSENQMYVNGWLVAHTTAPDVIGRITVHDRMTEETIRRRAQRFTDSL